MSFGGVRHKIKPLSDFELYTKGKNTNMTSQEQLQQWVQGVSIHNDDTGQCCLDFSCCQPELLTPKEERELFFVSQKDEHMRLLGMFLGRALSNKKDLHYRFNSIRRN